MMNGQEKILLVKKISKDFVRPQDSPSLVYCILHQRPVSG